MSPSTSSFSLAIEPVTSAPITVVLFHVGFCSVVETTYFGIEFILSAKPISSVRSGHAAAKPSYVVRPSNSASAPSSSSSLNLSPSAPRSKENAQPPRSKPSDPPGSSITPSSVTNSETTSLPMSFLRSGR